MIFEIYDFSTLSFLLLLSLSLGEHVDTSEKGIISYWKEVESRCLR